MASYASLSAISGSASASAAASASASAAYNYDLDSILNMASRGSARLSSAHNDNPNNCQPAELASPLPLNQYRLNDDPNPEVIRKKPQQVVNFTQNVAVRYLKPPAPAPGGDIIIKQLPDKQVAPAPALHVRQPQPSAPTPPPLIIREAPPPPPAPLPGKLHFVPGKVIPPPARKVITEYLPPVPSKPQKVIVDRWLPYEQPIQRVRYEPAKPACIIPDPKNLIIQWDAPDVQITQQFCPLGVHQANPAEYASKYGAQLLSASQLPELAIKFSSQAGIPLAANTPHNNTPILVGDVEYLRLIQQ